MVLENETISYNEPDEEEEEEEEEAELVDPLEAVRARCEQNQHCGQLKQRLEACAERVNSRSDTPEECTEELMDFLHARDHCVAAKLFHKLK